MYRSAVVGALRPFFWFFRLKQKVQVYYNGPVCISPVVALPPQF